MNLNIFNKKKESNKIITYGTVYIIGKNKMAKLSDIELKVMYDENKNLCVNGLRLNGTFIKPSSLINYLLKYGGYEEPITIQYKIPKYVKENIQNCKRLLNKEY